MHLQKCSSTVKALIKEEKKSSKTTLSLKKTTKATEKRKKTGGKWKKKKKTGPERGRQAEWCEAEKGAPCQGRWWMRFRLQARPAAPSGADSTLTLIMLCEMLRPRSWWKETRNTVRLSKLAAQSQTHTHHSCIYHQHNREHRHRRQERVFILIFIVFNLISYFCHLKKKNPNRIKAFLQHKSQWLH